MDEHISRILKMVEDGKISAQDATELISQVRSAQSAASSASSASTSTATTERPEVHQDTASETHAESGTSKSFEFQWGQKKQLPFDLSTLGKQISDAVKKVDPERIVKEARDGFLKGNKAWQDRMRQWSRFMEGDDGRPENSNNLPTATVTETFSFELPEDAILFVENHWGNVNVTGGADTFSLTAERTAWDDTPEEANERLRDMRVDTITPQSSEGLPARLEIRVSAADDWCDGTAKLTLSVPTAAAVRINTTFGDIAVSGLGGTVEAHSVNGHIRAENLTNTVRAESMAGDVQAENMGDVAYLASRTGKVSATHLLKGGEISTVSGHATVKSVSQGAVTVKSVSGDACIEDAGTEAPSDLTIEAVSGDATIRRCNGSVFIKTVSGDIRAEKVEAPVLQTEAVSGNVGIDLASPFTGTLTANTVSGNVKMRLSHDSGFRYTLGTKSGQLTCNIPDRDATRAATLCAGVVGEGQGTVNVHTTSGNISLTDAV